MALQSINPATGEMLQEYAAHSRSEVEAILARAEAAFAAWRDTPLPARAELLLRLAASLRARKTAMARMAALEMGKPLKDGEGEVEKCAAACEYFAHHGAAFLHDHMIGSPDFSKAYVSFRPLGPVLAVMPWNFPYWQVFRFAAPALLAGNVGLLKHASNVTGCALEIIEAMRDAQAPEGLFQLLKLPGAEVEKIIAHPEVQAVTLTGSTEAGRAVAAAAGKYLKKTVLELGGSDAYLILADADAAEAAKLCTQARLINAGQSCIAAKRLIVAAPLEKVFIAALKEEFAKVKMGDPLADGTTLGPLARHDLRDQLHEQVQRSVAAGAKLAMGGEVPQDKGAYYPPTILTNVRPGMAAYSEELFGPVATVITAQDEEDAIRIANDSVFGLGACVITADAARGERIARERLEAGSCFVNIAVRSDPRLPFGGIKQSGYGRELSSFGIHEFVNIKTVAVR